MGSVPNQSSPLYLQCLHLDVFFSSLCCSGDQDSPGRIWQELEVVRLYTAQFFLCFRFHVFPDWTGHLPNVQLRACTNSMYVVPPCVPSLKTWILNNPKICVCRLLCVKPARARLMGQMLRMRRSVLSAWVSCLEASSPCPTAAATSSASDASSHGQRWSSMRDNIIVKWRYQ